MSVERCTGLTFAFPHVGHDATAGSDRKRHTVAFVGVNHLSVLTGATTQANRTLLPEIEGRLRRTNCSPEGNDWSLPLPLACRTFAAMSLVSPHRSSYGVHNTLNNSFRSRRGEL
jgi:hypothetical protein